MRSLIIADQLFKSPFLLALLVVLFIGACAAAPPEATVAASVTSGQAPLSVTFTNNSINADEFRWDFGDGSSTTTGTIEEPVTHEYTVAGTYTFTFTAIKRGDPQETSSTTMAITVEPGPLARIVLSPASSTLEVNRVQQFTVEAFDQFDNPIPGLSLAFRSDERAGQVDSGGRFSAGTKAGTYDNGVTLEVTQGPVTKEATAKIIIEPGPLDHVALEPAGPTLGVTRERQFAATALDQFDNPIPGLRSVYDSDEQAGAVDTNGMFTAGTKAGTYVSGVTVEVTQGAITKSTATDVAIEAGPLEQVRIDPVAAILEVTEAQQFTSTALDQFNNPIPGLSYRYSSGVQAGQVGSDGRFTAGKVAGTYASGVTVEVTQGALTKTAKASVTVEPGALHQAILEPAAPALAVTKVQGFTAEGLDQFGNPIRALIFSFRSDQRAGKIDDAGGFTAGTAAGTYESAVTVEVIQGAATEVATVGVTIEPGPLDHVDLKPLGPRLEVTKERQFSSAAFDQFDNPIPDLTYVYRADQGAGQISTGGNFTAGTAASTYKKAVTVEVAQGTITADATTRVILIHGPLDRIVLGPGPVTLDIGQSQGFNVVVEDTHGNPTPEARITWEAPEQLGTITANGLLNAGTVAGVFDQGVKVTATLGDVSLDATASVTVNPDLLHDVSIPTDIEVAAGATVQIDASAVDQHGNRLGDVEVTLAVSDPDAGSITPLGLLTAGEVATNFPGVIGVQATQGALTRSATASVTIVPGPLEQVVIAPDPADIGMESTQQFVAVGADQYGNPISGLTFDWSVGTGSGTITTGGLFTAGTEPGDYDSTVKVTATQGSITGSATASVTVEPDRIVFRSNRSDDQPDVYLMNVDGTDVRRLTNDFGLSPTWSPDGRLVAYSDFFFGLLAMNDDGSRRATILEGDFDSERSLLSLLIEPAWSPDGSKITFVKWTIPLLEDGSLDFQNSKRDIFVGDVDGGNITRLTNTLTVDEFVPSWSPDGAKIVYDHTIEGGEGDIWVMDADGSNKTRLGTHPGNDSSPSFSPDGTQILFASSVDGDGEIYLMNADGTNIAQLTSNSDVDWAPSWSPGGGRIVFYSDRDGDDEIYVMDRDGSNQSRLTNNSASDGDPQWAPRKRGIAVSESSVVIPDSSTLKAVTVQELTASARGAVVRIEMDLASGSGFIIDPDGLILTNNHVISDASEITVFLDDGTSYTGTVEGRDLVRDLAVVKIEASGLPTLELGNLSRVGLGQQVVVLGYPLGVDQVTVTSGFVSSTDTDEGRNIIWVQTDSAVNPGNSGGPLLNLQGEVVGVVAAKFVSVAIEGVGFAISANTVILYLERLKAGEVIS